MSRVARWLPWVGGLLATALYCAISLLRFSRFQVASWDNAIFEQAVAAYSRFKAPIVPVKGPGINILGDHFSPIDALIAPFYWLFPHGQTLLVAQAVLLGFSVVVISRAAMRHLGTLAGVVTGALYALSFGLVGAVAVDFHEVAFAAPLLALVGEAWLDERYDWVVWWSLPLLLVKEDMGMTVAAIGIALMTRKGQLKRGAALALAGLVATVVVVMVLIPAFNTGGGYDYTKNLGGDAGIWTTLTAASGRKLLTLFVTAGVGGFVALASPWILVVVPTFVWRFTGTVDFYWGTDWHYSLVLMPIVFIAMIDVMRPRRNLMWVGLVVAAAFCGNQLADLPVQWVLQPQNWQQTADNRAAQQAVRQIPKGAVVESDLGLLAHLVPGRTVYWRGTVGDARPEYVVFDVRFSSDDPVEYAEQTHGGTWKLIWSDSGYRIAQRVG